MDTTSGPNAATTAHEATIGGELERMRLESRAQRLELVVRALRERADSHAANGAVPAGLRESIADFAQELAGISARLGRTPRTATNSSGGVRAVPRRRQVCGTQVARQTPAIAAPDC